MRISVTPEVVHRFARELSRSLKAPVRVYFTGGVTAVMMGWRTTTLDLDIKLDPDSDEAYRCLPGLKEKLEVNVELACPDDFIPPLPGWREKSIFIASYGQGHFFHYDMRAQALAKIERGHASDRSDVEHMLTDGLVKPEELLRVFGVIEADLIRYPAIDGAEFRRKVEETLRPWLRPPTGELHAD